MKAALAGVACLLLLFAGAQAARAARGSRIAAHQAIVILLAPHSVRDQPRAGAAPLAYLGATRPITAERTALPVLGQRIDEHGGSWLRVRLPGRSLGGRAPPPAGWISAANTQLSVTPWHIVVELGARRVLVYRDGRELRSYPAIVGKPSTPTPPGQYFVEENVQLPADRVGAPFALATSARSNVLQEFEGGPGQIALHGLDHIGGSLGSAVSHGCIRLADGAIAWLAARITPGVPITIA